MRKKYVVDLSREERERLEGLTSKGRSAARKIRRGRILLLADEGLKDKEIAEALNAAVSTVERVRSRFVEEGLEAALSERPRIGGALQRKLDGKGEAYLVALACSEPPEERERWTMQLLADRLVEEISNETVRRSLKKGTLSRG